MALKETWTGIRLPEVLILALGKEGLKSELDLELSRINAEELEKLNQLEQDRLAMMDPSRQAQIAAKEAEIEQLQGLFELRKQQLDKLKVRAGIAGVLQETPVEVGQQIGAGDILGRVAVPERLKAELRIPETQVKDVRIGLPALIDTRNGVVAGRVVRVDPAAREGAVLVKEALERVRMAHRMKHYPSQLSGGEQQGVAVARALGGRPTILLADEPTGNLDSKNGDAVMELLTQLHGEGATIGMVSHDPRYAECAERQIHLFDGQIVRGDGSNGESA